MMAGRTNRPAVDWGAVAGPILATSPWRLGTSWPPRAMAGAVADPHEHDWAGPGFTRPGPVPAAGPQTRCAPGKAKAPAGMATISDGPATSLTRRRHTPSRPVRRTGAEGRILP
jgi:hypothetical protein